MRLYLLGLSATLLAGVIAACDSPAEGPKPPTSPVGRYEQEESLVVAPGETAPHTGPSWRWSVEVRADHTFRYEWRSLDKGDASAGSLDGTWREATKDECDRAQGRCVMWVFVPRGEPDAPQASGPVRGRVAWARETGLRGEHGRLAAPNEWYFPRVSYATGMFDGTESVIHRR